MPLTFASDLEAIHAVISQVAEARKGDVKWIWIRDTLHVDQVLASDFFYEEALQRSDLQVIGVPKPLDFDELGDLEESLVDQPNGLMIAHKRLESRPYPIDDRNDSFQIHPSFPLTLH